MLIAFSKKTSLQLWHRLPTTPWFWMCSCFLGYHELHTSIPVSQCGPRNLYNLCLQGIWNCDTVMIAFLRILIKWGFWNRELLSTSLLHIGLQIKADVQRGSKMTGRKSTAILIFRVILLCQKHLFLFY